MKIEGLSDKAAVIVNQVANALIAVGLAVYFYDGWLDVTLGTVVAFAIMNFWDAVFAWVGSKLKKGEE